jgi:hypothetical protein
MLSVEDFVSQISSSRQTFQTFIADKRLTRQEVQTLQQAYHKENPQATEAQFEKWMADSLTGKTGSQDALATLQQLKSGKSDSVLLFFEDNAPEPPKGKAAPVQVRVEGLQLTDKNGFEQRSLDDLTGSIKKVDVTLSHDFVQQIAQGVVDALPFGKHKAEVTYVAGKDGGSGHHQIRVGGFHIADLRSDKGRLFLEYGSQPQPGMVAPRLDQTPDLITQSLSQAWNWVGEQANNAFDATVASVGQDPKAVRQSISDTVDGAVDWSRDKAAEGVAWAVGMKPEDMRKIFENGKLQVDAGSGIQSDIDLDWDSEQNRVYINPGNLSLNGKDLAGAGSILEGSRVTLTPEKPQLEILPDGRVRISSENAGLSGGTGPESPAADTPDMAKLRPTDAPPDRLTLNSAEAEIRSDGQRTSLEVTEAEGTLQAAGVLTDERIQVLKKQIDDALAAVDKKLAEYGIDRASLAKIFSQVPSDLLKSLLSSTNQGELAKTAANLGIDPTQLGQFVAFLQEQPVQGLLGDLQKLTGTLASNTQLQGNLSFKLDRLNLESSSQGLLLQLQGLDLKALISSKTPSGTQAETSVSAQLTSGALSSSDNTPPQLKTGQAKMALEATISEAQPPFETRLQAFVQDLNGRSNPKAYLTPKGITPGRSGLTIQTVKDLLGKLTPAEWQRVASGDDKSVQSLAAEKNLQPNYLLYMRKYFQDQGMNAPEQSKVTATAGLQAFSHSASETGIEKPEASLRVTTSANGQVTSEAGASLSATEVKLNPKEAAIQAAAKLMGFRIEMAQKPAKELLTPQGLSAGKTGLSYETVRGIMAKVTDAEWRALAKMEPPARSEFAQRKGIQPNYLDYLRDYFQKNGMLPAAAVASHVQLEADAKVRRSEGTTSSQVSAEATRVSASPEMIAAQGIEAQGKLDTPGADVAVKLSQGTLGASAERIMASGQLGPATVTTENGKFTVNQGQIWGAATPDAGLAVDAKADWSLDTRGEKARTQLNGNTHLAIGEGELQGSETTQLGGTSRIKSDELMRLAKNHPDLQAFLKLLGTQFRLNNESVTVALKDSSLITGDKGKVNYDLQLGVQKVETSLGPMDVQVRAANQGVSGNVTFSPNQMAVAWINGLVSEALKKPTQTTLNQGRIEVKFDHSVVSDIVIGARITGDQVEIKVDQAKLFGFLDLDFIRGSARDTVLEQLQKMRISRASGKGETTVTLPVQALMAQALGPEAAGRTTLKPTLGSDNRLRVAFDYRP